MKKVNKYIHWKNTEETYSLKALKKQKVIKKVYENNISGFLQTNKNLIIKTKGHYSLPKFKKNIILIFSFIKMSLSI